MHRRRKVDEKSCVNGKKTHTHTMATIVQFVGRTNIIIISTKPVASVAQR